MELEVVIHLYLTLVLTPHADTFWQELEEILTSLAPNVKYGVLLQPELSNGSRVTLGSSFLTDNQPKMEEMINHYQPFITKLEEDYNESFCGQTRVKIRALPPTQTAAPAPSRPKQSS
jgi:hypothetical protein